MAKKMKSQSLSGRRSTASESSVGATIAPRDEPTESAAWRTAPAPVPAERIAARAYELYLQRGGADGAAADDWFAAERELSQTAGD